MKRKRKDFKKQVFLKIKTFDTIYEGKSILDILGVKWTRETTFLFVNIKIRNFDIWQQSALTFLK